MTQNIVDFSDNPTGPELMDNYLAKLQDNVNTSNSGNQRPSYAVAGMRWIDTSTKPWMLKVYDGKNDIIEGYVDTDKGLFTPAGIDSVLDYTNITNCLTEIPQDIKLELNDGTLTLKAGSKVYVPNGVGVFNVRAISSDIQATSVANGTFLYAVHPDGSIARFANAYSGATEPISPENLTAWYDTENNVVKRYNGTSWESGFSLPMAVITISSGAITSIDQVFNGFGYIGNTIFALPGIKGLIPNGFNTDGSLNSIEFTTTNVLTVQAYYSSNIFGIFGKSELQCRINSQTFYDKNKNKYINFVTGNRFIFCKCGDITVDSTGRITSLTPNTAFHATDYNEFAREVGRCAKLDDSNTFISNAITLQSNPIDRDTNPSKNLYCTYLIKDKNNKQIGNFYVVQRTDGSMEAIMLVTGRDGQDAKIVISKKADGTVSTSVPTPPTNDNGNQIATTAWVRQVAALKDLSNISENIDYVVESGGDTEKWYRLYKSGWLVQGGYLTEGSNQTVTLLKPYKDTKYVILAIGEVNACRPVMIREGSVTVSAFQINTRNYTDSITESIKRWKTEGYGA